MSWNISIEYTLSEDVRNLTYNNSAILTYLHIHPHNLELLKNCEQVLLLLKAAKLLALTDEEELKKLNPHNGWGGLEDVKKFIDIAIEKCEEFPQGKFKVE